MSLEQTFSPPTVGEMQGRLARVQAAMAEQKLDFYVSFSPDNIYYLTNFANFVHERPFVLVVPKAGKPKFVVPKLEIPHVTSRAIGEIELVSYAEFPAPKGQRWSDYFRKLFPPNARVGVESICPLQVYEEIPGTPVRSDIIDDVRMIKSAYEMGRMAYSCALVTDAHNQLLAEARPGRSLSQVISTYSGQIMRRALTDNPSLNVQATRIIAVFQPAGVAHDPHNFTDINMQMEAGGPHVSIINATINGYGAEVERTWFLGHVPEAARKPFEVMMQARRLAFELTVPGNMMSEVDTQVIELFKKAGYEQALLHRTGHGMGVTGHEAPFLAAGYDRVIEPGMSFSIEPGIYIPGIGGFRHSDTILTTSSGNVALTSGPSELEDLILPIPAE